MNPTFLLTRNNQVLAVLDNSETDALLSQARMNHVPIHIKYFVDATYTNGLSGLAEATFTDLSNRTFTLHNLTPIRDAIHYARRETGI